MYTAELYNNDFHDIRGGRLVAAPPYVRPGYGDVEGAAISGHAANPYGYLVTTATRVVVDYTAGSAAKFRNCDKGIYLNGPMSAGVQHADMLGGWGIYCEGGHRQQHAIQNNLILNAVTAIYTSGGNHTSLISHNTVAVDGVTPAPGPAVGAFYAATGIGVAEYYVPKLSASYTVQVDNNQVDFSATAGTGIDIFWPSSATSVYSNIVRYFNYGLRPFAYSTAFGISTTTANNTLLRSNQITTISYTSPANTIPALTIAGLHLEYSKGCVLSCNTTSNVQYGFQVDGDCATLNANVTKNTFSNHTYDMLFRHNGIEGTLGDIGSNTIDCRNQDITSGTSPLKLFRITACGSGGVARNTIFTTLPVISSSNMPCMNAAYYAVSSPGAVKIQSCNEANNGPVFSVTPATNPVANKIARDVASNMASYSEYFSGADWMERSDLFRLLKAYPALMSGDSLMTAFYQNTLGTAIGNVEQVNDLIAGVDTAADATSFQQAWQSASAANAVLQTPDRQTQNEQAINNLYLKYAAGGFDVLTAADSSILGSVALQCPLAGGYAVFKARSLYAHYQPLLHYNDLGLCNHPNPADPGNAIFDGEEAFLDSVNAAGSTTGNRMAPAAGREGMQVVAQLQLYPNPVTGLLNIAYPQPGTLEISDITGRSIKTLTLSGAGGGKATLGTSDMPAGLMICRYYVAGRLMEVRKIVVQHD